MLNIFDKMKKKLISVSKLEGKGRMPYLPYEKRIHSDDASVIETKKQEMENYIKEKLKVLYPDIQHGMNDGQFFLSKEIVHRLLPNFFSEHKRIIINILDNSKSLMSDEKTLYPNFSPTLPTERLPAYNSNKFIILNVGIF